jgi:uncharacterized protein (UPF0303 family)
MRNLFFVGTCIAILLLSINGKIEAGQIGVSITESASKDREPISIPCSIWGITVFHLESIA